MDIGSISAALGGLRTAVDLAKLAVEARDDQKIASAVQSLNDRIIEIQGVALQLQEKQASQLEQIQTLKDDKRELSARVADLEKQADEQNRYRLRELSTGVFVYAYEPVDGDAAPAHYLCQSCMDNKSQKAVLVRDANGTYERCPVCKNRYRTGVPTPPFNTRGLA
ncbi:hypothetical protein ACPRNU_21325 [Chromobacterium vaccinii]|uniref:hypothetical protein n=1 Tax=Chromobacterium vaccinii TaxID=1108595 RepID=UPI003C721A5B